MRRCLQLARCGRINAKPNPMVGAVIVAPACRNGLPAPRIIGEGYHVRCGEGHAEVNAFASVRPGDEPLLSQSTMFVSLEPCSHYGKTPPCADLIIKKGVRKVVIGCIDDFSEVQGRGVQKLRDAGIDVTVGVLEEECRWLNCRFFTFHREHRPYIILKWAQTANGFIDDRPVVGEATKLCRELPSAAGDDTLNGEAHVLAISTPFTMMLVHKLRAEEDAIAVGRVTDEREHPLLNVRHWIGPNPKRIVLSSKQFESLDVLMDNLYHENIQSLIVEGGQKTLESFIGQGLWDEIRVETNMLLTVSNGTPAPLISHLKPHTAIRYGGNIITTYYNKASAV